MCNESTENRVSKWALWVCFIIVFKAGGDKCLKSLKSIFNDILFEDKLLEEWMLSLLNFIK